MKTETWGCLFGLVAAFCYAGDTAEPSVVSPLPTEKRPLAERFAEPPPSARILRILHKQPDQPEAQDRLLRTLASQGFGGFVCNVAFDGYVDDESKWPAFLRGVRLGKAAGMDLWLYDECGYPSGSARDLTLRGHPEWAARGLLIAETNTTGGAVSLALPPGRLVRAAALPRRDGQLVLDAALDLAASVTDGKLTWQAPAGDWFVTAMTDDLIYEGTHAAVSLAFKKPYINLLMKEPTARFLEVTHDRYAEKLGHDLGAYFASTFTDEPSLMSLWMRPMPYRVLPWSETLPAEFRKRSGADLLPLLPALVADAGPRGAKARYDFWNTVADLVSENYFGQIQTWCRRHDLASGGHLLMEEGLVTHVPLYGDFFRCARRLDAPSIDCLTSLPPEVPWYIARMITSIAELENRPLTMCEVSDHSQRYRAQGDTRPVRLVTEDEIRGTCNRLVWGGIDTLTSYYAFKNLSDEQLRRINLHIGRCSTMLAGGHQVSDLALLYPIESVWPKFAPAAHRGSTDEMAARHVESAFDTARTALYSAALDFRFVDARALCEAKARNGAMRHGDLSWRVLVLPATDTLPLDAWENVARFWRRGGAVIALGARPANSEREFPSARVQAIAAEVFGSGASPCTATNAAGGIGVLLPPGMTALLPKVVDALVERDAVCEGTPSAVKISHRRVDNHDVYFAINDSAAAWSGNIRFCGRGVTELWNPDTGKMSPLTAGASVPVQLGPYGAVLFRTEKSDEPRRLHGPGVASFSMRCEPLSTAAKPTVGQGEFVRSTLTGDNASGWCATGTLTKGQVDTHLFVSFALDPSASLAGCDGLAIETTAPAGQRTSAEVLVFVHTRSGGDYLAGTGRYLSAAGTARAFVLFSQFQPFHGARQTDVALDLSQIVAVRIGWGGYYGAEGEQVSLTIKPPQRFVCGSR